MRRSRPDVDRAALTDLGRGRPIVFLHGWSVDRSFFAGQHALADEGFRVVAPDQAGHRAGETAGSLSLADLADDLDFEAISRGPYRNMVD